MRLYETMLIVDARLSDGDVEKALERFSGLVTENGGEVRSVDKWGRRRFAQEVDGQFEGFYTVYTYSIEPDKLRTIAQALPFVDGLVRHKTVRPEFRTRRAM